MYLRSSVLGGMYGGGIAQMFNIDKYPFLLNNVIEIKSQDRSASMNYSIAQLLCSNLNKSTKHIDSRFGQYQTAYGLYEWNWCVLNILPRTMFKIHIYRSTILLPISIGGCVTLAGTRYYTLLNWMSYIKSDQIFILFDLTFHTTHTHFSTQQYLHI